MKKRFLVGFMSGLLLLCMNVSAQATILYDTDVTSNVIMLQRQNSVGLCNYLKILIIQPSKGKYSG